MNDGIIQDIFQSWIKRNDVIAFGSRSDRIQRLQQELIEKIKQELYVNWLGEIQKQELLRKLIGDTK